MAEALDNKTISKNNSGFPEYLDFQKLRSSAIAYLGNLSGNIWTDHNVHDPGITILESLIYAILDLGYRTNLPIADLLARDPQDANGDNDFFTPAEILACNPLTIIDYRKMLIDIEGVKNAWLEIDKDSPVIFCSNDPAGVPAPGGPNAGNNPGDPCDCDYLNGLYHVYIQLEDAILANKHLKEKVLRIVKQKLMAHRNLCEDYIDIQVLCTLEVGICADIELEPTVDAGTVYLQMVSVLRDYFSPTPKFYSLQELLTKNKSIDAIYAGRPLDTSDSHGFLDTDELALLSLRRELHLSDVYHLLFDIPGIHGVRNLRWLQCGPIPLNASDWKLEIPENYVTDFSTDCSGFNFFKNDIPIAIDLKRFASFLKLNFSDHQKILYSKDSPILNAAFPIGGYRNDLSNYYSLANDFPRNYGIGEGDLNSDVADARKAQALQLQGFLLFFDQLLVNYLSQLKHLRSLFSLSSSGVAENQHTYFIQQLTNTPQLNKLLRFSINSDGTSALGGEGSTLVYPTDRSNIQDFINNSNASNPVKHCYDRQEDEFPLYSWCFATIRDQAVHQLMDDMLTGDYQAVITTNENNCYFFYVLTSSSDFGLVSKQFYPSEAEAKMAAASIQYISTFEGNYQKLMISDDDGSQRFTFDVVLNIDTYADYLQLIVENTELYESRRQDFLKHLMARFAETFADYALLTAGFLTDGALQTSSIEVAENFLTHYPDISSNRGKASNYGSYKWGNANISGFEKRFKALAGITNVNRHYLCNFVVEPADKLFTIAIQLFNKPFIVENEVFNEDQAIVALQSLYTTLKNPDFEVSYISHEEKWKVYMPDDRGIKLYGQDLFPDKITADTYRQKLIEVTHFEPYIANDILITRYIHKVFFADNAGSTIAESITHFVDPGEAETFGKTVVEKLNDYLNNPAEFLLVKPKFKTDRLIPLQTNDFPNLFLDEREFRFKSFDVIHLDKEKKNFSVVNKAATLQFDSLLEFDNLKLAREGFKNMLVLLTNTSNYKIDHGIKEGDGFTIFIENEGQRKAIYYESFQTRDAAHQKLNWIFELINTYIYQLYISDRIADEWEFKYRSSDLSGHSFNYLSTGHFKNAAAVEQALTTFYVHIPELQVMRSENRWGIALELSDIKIYTELSDDKFSPDDFDLARNILTQSQDLLRKITKITPEDFSPILERSRINPGEDFVYKLVDKDNIRALHPSQNPISDETTAESVRNDLITKALAGYVSTDISTSGDIIRERVDVVTGISWFHFLIRSDNRKYTKGGLQNQNLIYFESTRGYASADEALQAFDETYLLILKYGRHTSSYGPNLLISLKELFIHNSDLYTNSKSIAFVPGETVYEFDGLDIPRKMVTLSTACPIQFVGKNKYRFQLCRIDEVPFTCIIDWRSKETFTTARDAILAYKAFRMFLLYPGNYILIWDDVACVYKIGIREVLAISAHGFVTPEEAWGIDGVEKFICVSQSQEGFHTYLTKDQCFNSFYVACGNMGLKHPCIYDTPERRDAVIDGLYKAAAFSFFDLVHTVTDDFIILTDLNQQPLVHINFLKRQEINFSPCKWLVIFFQTVFMDDHYKREEGILHLNYYDFNENINFNLGDSLIPGISLKDWKIQLKKIANFFPVTETTVDCGTQNEIRYSVVIRLPGFGGDELVPANPCYKKDDDDCVITCDVAWQSDCCFESCCEALDFYAQSFELLRSFDNYKKVYDCPCGTYRIDLVPLLTLSAKELLVKREFKLAATINAICADTFRGQHDPKSALNQDTLVCFNEIMAVDPQHYTDEAMACNAVVRAKTLINSEGLHLVEHILLRPRCKDENGIYRECACDALSKPCINVDNACHFEWKPLGDQDPCETLNQICFTPGCDPYSFIATVFLPGWPERFRQDYSRQYIEKMLQREAPAHVLLRIIWLTPQDLFQLESLLIAWNVELSGKNCKVTTTYCDLIRFLFRDAYHQSHICTDCKPCTCTTDTVSCTPDEAVPCDSISFAGKLNELFCWTDNS